MKQSIIGFANTTGRTGSNGCQLCLRKATSAWRVGNASQIAIQGTRVRGMSRTGRSPAAHRTPSLGTCQIVNTDQIRRRVRRTRWRGRSTWHCASPMTVSAPRPRPFASSWCATSGPRPSVDALCASADHVRSEADAADPGGAGPHMTGLARSRGSCSPPPTGGGCEFWKSAFPALG